MYRPQSKPRRRIEREERYGQIMQYMFFCYQRHWKPSSHAVALELGLKPSQYVRGLLADLHGCGIIEKREETMSNGMVVHEWKIDLEYIENERPEWREYLEDKFHVWPEYLKMD